MQDEKTLACRLSITISVMKRRTNPVNDVSPLNDDPLIKTNDLSSLCPSSLNAPVCTCVPCVCVSGRAHYLYSAHRRAILHAGVQSKLYRNKKAQGGFTGCMREEKL